MADDGALGAPWDLGRFRQRLPTPRRRIALDWCPPRLDVRSLEEAAARLASLAPVPAHRPGTSAAVLVVLTEIDGRLGLLLTRRADGLRLHAGEVAFPGGRAHAGETLLATALRESREEVGLEPSQVEVVGSLGLGFTRRQRDTFEVIVGLVRSPLALVENPEEVAAVRWVLLEELADPVRAASELWFDPRAGWFRVWLFDLGEDLLWGASARVVAELLYVLGVT